MKELEEKLRETQATAQRLETHLKQKEKFYEDKIKVNLNMNLIIFWLLDHRNCSLLCSVVIHCLDEMKDVSYMLVLVLWLPGFEQVLETQMKADMADKEMLESSQSKYEEEVREKCSVISEQKAVSIDQLGNDATSGVLSH